MPILPKHIVLTLLLFLLYKFVPGQTTVSYTINSEGSVPKILTLEKNSKGFFLVGTTEGLYRFDGRGFTPYAISTAIVSKSITAIGEDKNSTVWVGFKSGEIGFLKDKIVESLQAQEGHPTASI